MNDIARLARRGAVAATSRSCLPASARAAQRARRTAASSRWSCPSAPARRPTPSAASSPTRSARHLRQSVVVDNRAGAGGSTGTDQVAKAAPDGRTLVMGTVGTHAINAGLFRKLPYDPMRDFAPVAFVGYTPTLLVVAADSPAKSLKDLAALAARPEGVTFASAGNGTSGHLAGEMLAQRLGGKMIHVPYKEGAVALTSVMSRQVDFMFYHPAAAMPQIKAGKLRALGASGAVRSAAAPDVPTLMEQGVKDFDLVAWFMLYAPAATPPATLAQLREHERRGAGSARDDGPTARSRASSSGRCAATRWRRSTRPRSASGPSSSSAPARRSTEAR